MKIMWQQVALVMLVPLSLGAQTTSGVMSPVLTRAYDNSRTGTTTTETTLTATNVAQRGVRKYFSLFMEGDARGAEAQPLILPKVKTVGWQCQGCGHPLLHEQYCPCLRCKQLG